MPSFQVPAHKYTHSTDSYSSDSCSTALLLTLQLSLSLLQKLEDNKKTAVSPVKLNDYNMLLLERQTLMRNLRLLVGETFHHSAK